MQYKTHLAFSLFLFFIIRGFVENLDTPLWAAALVFLFGSIFPDIDSMSSFLGSKIKFIGFLSEHRGVFHSIFMAILLAIIIGVFDIVFGILFLGGYLSHLALDMLNYKGIAIFYPISRFRIKGVFKSGKIADRIIFLISLIGVILFMLLD